jgi:HK97 family phage major capsid protein
MAKAKQNTEQPPAVQEQTAATQPPERLSLAQLKEQHKAAKAAADELIEAAKTQEEFDKADEALAGVELLSRRISLMERGESQAQFLRRPNGTPPRVTPNQPIPGEEPAALAATGVHTLAKARTAYDGDVFKDEEEAHYAALWTFAMSGHPCNATRTKRQRDAHEWVLANPAPFVAAHTEFDDLTGGIFVPEQILGPVERLKHAYGVGRGAVNVVPTNRDVLKWPKGLTGVQFAAIGEQPGINGADSMTEYTATADQVVIPVEDHGAWTRLSRDLEEDQGVAIAEMLTRQFADAAAYREDLLIFSGSASKADSHISGLTVAINATDASASCFTATGHTTFATLTLGDFESMAGQLPEFPGGDPKWYISKPGYFASMARLMDAAGGNTKSDLAGGTGLQFLGYPVVFTRILNTTLTSITGQFNACLFGTPRLGATFADRRGMTVEPNPYLYMANRQLALFLTMRFGFNVHELTALAGDQSTAICGPVVNLVMG